MLKKLCILAGVLTACGGAGGDPDLLESVQPLFAGDDQEGPTAVALDTADASPPNDRALLLAERINAFVRDHEEAKFTKDEASQWDFMNEVWAEYIHFVEEGGELEVYDKSAIAIAFDKFSKMTSSFLRRYRGVRTGRTPRFTFTLLSQQIAWDSATRGPWVVQPATDERIMAKLTTRTVAFKGIMAQFREATLSGSQFRIKFGYHLNCLSKLTNEVVQLATTPQFTREVDGKMTPFQVVLTDRSIMALADAVSFAETSAQAGLISEEEAANIENHAGEWFRMRETLRVMASFKDNEFSGVHKIIRSISADVGVTSRNALQSTTETLAHTGYDYDALHLFQIIITKGITQQREAFEAHHEKVMKMTSGGVRDVTFSLGSLSATDPGSDVPKLYRRVTKDYMKRWLQYDATTLQFYKEVETELQRYSDLAMHDRIAIGRMKLAGTPAPRNPVRADVDLFDSPGTPASFDSDEKGVPDERDDSKETDDDLRLESDSAAVESSEAILTNERDFYKRMSFLFRAERALELNDTLAPPKREKLSNAARDAWSKMNHHKTVKMSHLVAFFGDLKRLGWVYSAQLTGGGLTVRFNNKVKHTFHFRHYAFDTATLNVIKSALNSSGVNVEAML